MPHLSTPKVSKLSIVLQVQYKCPVYVTGLKYEVPSEVWWWIVKRRGSPRSVICVSSVLRGCGLGDRMDIISSLTSLSVKIFLKTGKVVDKSKVAPVFWTQHS